jgi:acetyltransferase-like isoleucine patch superfamily enzyme
MYIASIERNIVNYRPSESHGPWLAEIAFGHASRTETNICGRRPLAIFLATVTILLMSLSLVDEFLLRVRRGQTPFYRTLKGVAVSVRSSSLPTPGLLRKLARGAFYGHQALWRAAGFLRSYLYTGPLFSARCEAVGKRFRVCRMPFVVGHAKIRVGDDCNFFGKVDIMSGGIFDEPALTLGNRVDIGHNVVFLVNKEIVIEDDVNVASGVRFMDSDAHPRDTAERIADLPPRPEEVKPVHVCRYAWIGQNSFILKGVTIGEGAIVGVNSVVVTDIPPYSVAMGNPARVVVKNAVPIAHTAA